MSLPDTAMPGYMDLVTRWSPADTQALKGDLDKGAVHPMEAKKKLAWEIVSSIDGDSAADAAAARFSRVHQERELPADMPEYSLAEAMKVVDILVQAGLTQSKGEARRLIQQGGVRVDGQTIEDIHATLEPAEAVVQVGKRRFLRLAPAGD
jgi:tyrosyl-tRNA synthetase